MDMTRLDRLATTIGDTSFQKFIDATISDIVSVRGRIASEGELLPDEFRGCAHKLVGLFSQAGLIEEAAVARGAMTGVVDGKASGARLVGMCDDAVRALHAYSAERAKQAS